MFYDISYLNIAGAVPSLNLPGGEQTEKAQQVIHLQQEADQVSGWRHFKLEFVSCKWMV